MKNREVYLKDPAENRLLNDGVAEVTDGRSDAEMRTLRYELETFVCDGEYAKGLRRILDTYLRNLDQPMQPGVWVSGFFGSGKSHLVKMLRALWVDLEAKLQLILKGEPPCDIFVRWKPSEQQPVGWDPDLNDGVRMNIRPFMRVGDVGKKGAGILRDKPNIKWGKDRGKDPSDAPWYHLGPQYGGKEGDRINDHPLTLAEKQAAQDATGGEP